MGIAMLMEATRAIDCMDTSLTSLTSDKQDAPKGKLVPTAEAVLNASCRLYETGRVIFCPKPEHVLAELTEIVRHLHKLWEQSEEVTLFMQGLYDTRDRIVRHCLHLDTLGHLLMERPPEDPAPYELACQYFKMLCQFWTFVDNTLTKFIVYPNLSELDRSGMCNVSNKLPKPFILPELEPNPCASIHSDALAANPFPSLTENATTAA